MVKKQDRKKKRQIEIKEPVTYFYIFCEGERTEPNYFEKMKSIINKDAMYKDSVNIEIVGTGMNTLSVLKYAKEYIKRNKINQGEVWCVYDKDDFKPTNFNDTEKNMKDLNEQELHYHAAWSNECIEYWFILHFVFFTANSNRRYYFEYLNKKFLELGFGKYKKNDTDIFNILTEYGNPKQAIKWAEKRLDDCQGKTPADSVPATKVHILVQELVKYFPENIKSRYV